MIKQQIYDDYWQFTLAWTDFNSNIFIDTLKIIVNFIDNNNKPYSEKLYKDLQNKIHEYHKIEYTSIRKGINQFVKMGFINYHLESYHRYTKAFLNATTDEERNIILSKIVFDNSSFRRSVSKQSNCKEISFLIKTIEHNGALKQAHVPAIMSIDLNKYNKEYITTRELDKISELNENIDFAKRKYNQISYLENLLKKLNSIYYDKNTHKYFIKETKNIAYTKEEHKKGRNTYSQQLYKEMLKIETIKAYKSKEPRCMIENLPYPVLIASHIKPYKDCNNDEQFDVNNGLLLSKDLDTLFDKYLISFDINGNMLYSSKLHADLKNYLSSQKYCLSKIFLTKKRCEYLKYHNLKL